MGFSYLAQTRNILDQVDTDAEFKTKQKKQYQQTSVHHGFFGETKEICSK